MPTAWLVSSEVHRVAARLDGGADDQKGGMVMPVYQVIRKTEVAEPIELDEATVMDMTAAAQALGIGLSALSKAISLGRFTEIIDPTAKLHQRRRLLLKAEVEEAIAGKR